MAYCFAPLTGRRGGPSSRAIVFAGGACMTAPLGKNPLASYASYRCWRRMRSKSRASRRLEVCQHASVAATAARRARERMRLIRADMSVERRHANDMARAEHRQVGGGSTRIHAVVGHVDRDPAPVDRRALEAVRLEHRMPR